MDATASATRHVVFSVSGRVLALPAAAVRRFLPLPRLDIPPTAPPVVAGVFRYQGQTVPVLRLDILLGLAPTSPGLYAPLLLIERDGRPLALLGDRVLDIVPAITSHLPENGLSFNGCAVGEFPFGTDSATVLEPERLLTETEGRMLAAFQAMADERLAKWQSAPSTTAEGAEPAA